jgi:hypothetical protein
MRVDWNGVHVLLSTPKKCFEDKNNAIWIAVKSTNICTSWFEFMLERTEETPF